MLKNFLFLLSVAIVITSCTSTVTVDVDNSFDEDAIVNINGDDHEIPAFSSMEIEVNKGENQVKTTVAGDVVFEENVEVTGAGVLNATGATYVKWNDLYLENLDEYDQYESKLDIKDVEINGELYEDMDLTVYEESFIKEDWDYGLETYWPDEVTVTAGYTTKSKLYRLTEFEDEFYFDWEDEDYDFSDLDLDESLLDSLEDILEGLDLGGE